MASNITTTPVVSSSIASVSPTSTPPPVSTPTTTIPRPITTTSTPNVPTTSITTANTPQTTAIVTSIITQINSQTTLAPETVIVTRTPTQASTPSTSTPSTSSSTSGAVPSGGSKSSDNGGGLGSGATVAIAVVIPIVVIALLVIGGLFFWRRRKQRQSDAEQRKEEMEGYGYNPNNDPTLPTVAATDELAAAGGDAGGYRGWGAAGMVGRKTSTQGNTTHVSDGYGAGSPGQVSDPSADPLMRPRADTIEEGEAVGALGVAGAAAGKGGVKRGPSNASSSYSAGDHSANSVEPPMPPIGSYQENYSDNAYYQSGPYDNNYGGAQQQPVIRDNPARRNTRIQEPTMPMHQGTSGIAQNF